jgi:hypothetical protein
VRAGPTRSTRAPPRFTIDAVRADAEVTRAAGEFISLMVTGDVVAVEALLRRYVTVSPEVEAVLKRIGAAPPQQRIMFRTADQLDPSMIAAAARWHAMGASCHQRFAGYFAQRCAPVGYFTSASQFGSGEIEVTSTDLRIDWK